MDGADESEKLPRPMALGLKKILRKLIPQRKRSDEQKHLQTPIPGYHELPFLDYTFDDSDQLPQKAQIVTDRLTVYEEVDSKNEQSIPKYSGAKCVLSWPGRTGVDESLRGPQPCWYFMLERPLREQYALMSSYARQLSVLSSLQESAESIETEEEDQVSSDDSFTSDLVDLPDGSELMDKYREAARKRRGGICNWRAEIVKNPVVSRVQTLQTEEFDMFIQESSPAGELPTSELSWPDPERAEPSWANPSSLQLIEHDPGHLTQNLSLVSQSSNGLPNIADFDVSCHLSEFEGCVELARGGGDQWRNQQYENQLDT